MMRYGKIAGLSAVSLAVSVLSTLPEGDQSRPYRRDASKKTAHKRSKIGKQYHPKKKPGVKPRRTKKVKR